jgi:GT2 family glycosyltransferase
MQINPSRPFMREDTMSEDQQPAVDADVIILSWNRVQDTIAAIQSAHNQVGVSKRILIVDQGSDHDNLAQLETFLRAVPEARLLKLSQNSGVAGGRNIASALGSARYIVALDSDAEFADPTMLARAVKELDEHPHLCAIGFRIENFFTGKNDETSWDYPAGRTPDQTFLTTRFIGAGHAIRRSVFEAVGAYDARLFFCGEELDLCYRMLNTDKRIAYVPEVAIRHKVSPEHRVFWGKGRFFYTVRNNIYTAYKFKTPLPRLVLAAGAFIIKGMNNGIGKEALRAIKAAVAMCWAYRKSSEDKSHYALSRETLEYIRRYEPNRSESVVRKFRRQFSRLPHQG